MLALTFVCRDENGLFGRDRKSARGALWAIGVLAAPPMGGASVRPATSAARPPSPLSAALIADGERFPVRIVSDTTQGMLSTGALLLDLSGVVTSPREFTIELRSIRGFARPPRVLRIEPNVVPIQQGYAIDRELHVSTGQPDWSFVLNAPGLRFSEGEQAVKVEVTEPTGLATWLPGRLCR